MALSALALLTACLDGDGGDDSSSIPDTEAIVEDSPCGDYDRSDASGASWTWAYDEDQGWPATWTTVASTTTLDGREVYALETEGEAQPPGYQEYRWTNTTLIACEEGWVSRLQSSASLYTTQGGTPGESHQVILYPEGYVLRPVELAVGQTWTGGGQRQILNEDGELIAEDTKSWEAEVVEESSVEVPAGEYASLRLVQDGDFAHVVKGIGTVRWEGFSWLVSTEGL